MNRAAARLHSPIESHFAVTPTIDSKNNSPANGFTSIECGKLLCEELDNLELVDPTTHESKESIACSDDLVPIHSSSPSTNTDDLVPINSTTVSIENLNNIDNTNKSEDLAPVHVKQDDKIQLNDLLSPVEESISMFTQLSDKLAEMSTEDSGVDTAHNVSDEETCRPEVCRI